MDLNALLGSNSGALTGPLLDTSETVHISGLALLKMLRHGRAGVPMEVMGLLLGTFPDDYTVNVMDVFAMPQSGTGVSVEAVDPVFQTHMLDALRQTGRTETVVGWYHSHPGFGPWLSSVDCNTQASFEALHKRAVAVVVDPIQSVRGRVVMDAFRLIPPSLIMQGLEPRQSTGIAGHLNRPSLMALIHGLNRQYYSIAIKCTVAGIQEQAILQLLHRASWADRLAIPRDNKEPVQVLEGCRSLISTWNKEVREDMTLSQEQKKVLHVGKQDPRRHLLESADALSTTALLGQLSLYLHAQ